MGTDSAAAAAATEETAARARADGEIVEDGVAVAGAVKGGVVGDGEDRSGLVGNGEAGGGLAGNRPGAGAIEAGEAAVVPVGGLPYRPATADGAKALAPNARTTATGRARRASALRREASTVATAVPRLPACTTDGPRSLVRPLLLVGPVRRVREER